jgi:hypothetical protein
VAGYSGTPLTTKLGIKEGHRVAILGAPDEFALDLPDGVTVSRRLGKAHDVILFFTAERSRFAARLEDMTAAIRPNGSLWVAWPKKASKVPTDMTDHVVREIALPTGVVDNKVCAIDDTWSGLRLVWRVERR